MEKANDKGEESAALFSARQAMRGKEQAHDGGVKCREKLYRVREEAGQGLFSDAA